MPIEILYLVTVFVVALIAFCVFKRPLYEAMLFSFAALIAVTSIWPNNPDIATWKNIGTYMLNCLQKNLRKVLKLNSMEGMIKN